MNALGESKQVVLDVGGMSCQHPIPLYACVVGARLRGGGDGQQLRHRGYQRLPLEEIRPGDVGGGAY